MFEKESYALKEIILTLDENKTKLGLDLGSSNRKMREVFQPYINKNVHRTLAQKGIRTLCSDVKNDDGIDLVGSILDEVFLDKIKKLNFDLILCTNVLEHVENVDLYCKQIAKISKKCDLIITVPYRYPWHYDPIDNHFRPTIKELSERFNEFKLIKGAYIEVEREINELIKNPLELTKLMLRLLVPLKSNGYKTAFYRLLYLFKKRSVTLVHLKRK